MRTGGTDLQHCSTGGGPVPRFDGGDDRRRVESESTARQKLGRRVLIAVEQSAGQRRVDGHSAELRRDAAAKLLAVEREGHVHILGDVRR